MTKQQEKVDELYNCYTSEENNSYGKSFVTIDIDSFTQAMNEFADWVRQECAEAINQYPLFKDVPGLVAYNDIDKFGSLAYEKSELQRLILNAGK